MSTPFFHKKLNLFRFVNKKINILIIDDVFTTGTTLNEISFEIRKIENIDKIGVLTVARVN